MPCAALSELPDPPANKSGWPWDTVPPCPIETGLLPRVTITVPVFNSAAYLEESLRSVLLQGYPDLELLVFDAASSDGSIDIIRRYERFIDAWVSEPDRGQSHAINKGLARASGTFFNWHNADDVLAAGSLFTMATALLDNVSCSHAHGYRTIIGPDSERLVEGVPKGEPAVDRPRTDTALAALMPGSLVGGLVRTQFATEVGGVDETLHYVMDIDLLLRLHLRGPAYDTASLGCYFREHSEAKSMAWTPARAGERLIVARKLFGRPTGSAQAPARYRRRAFASAHRFAWIGLAICGHGPGALWHLALDIAWAPRCDWAQRRRALQRIRDESGDKRSVVFERIARPLVRIGTSLTARLHVGRRPPSGQVGG